MSDNLLELLKDHLSGDVVSNLASLMGESPQNAETALHTAIPSLLAGLVDKSTDTDNLGNLFKLLTDGNHDGGILSNLGALSRGGEATSSLLADGGKMLSAVFGDKVSGIADLVANASGISKTSSSSMLGFITPVVMGLIGKTLKIGNMDTVAGLASLLGGQSGFLKNVIPAGLGNLLSGDPLSHALSSIDDPIGKATSAAAVISGQTGNDFDKAIETLDFESKTPNVVPETDFFVDTIGDIGHKIEDAADELGESATKLGSEIIHEGKEFAHTAADAFEETAQKSGGILPWILAAAALALVWGLLKSCATTDTAPENTATSTAVTTPTPAPVAAVPTAQPTPVASEPAKIEVPAVEKVSDFFEKTLSTGYVIKAAKDGFESKLIGFIESDQPIDKDLWFTMDGIMFDTNKASIRTESNSQINHLTEILKAYPKVKIKIGGYTDNTGKAKANLKLSKNRASAVKKALISAGIADDRVDAEGYGSEHPVASNNTEDGKQRNRRIDVRVTEK
jgi:OmpA-OmpF porin, OOP family